MAESQSTPESQTIPVSQSIPLLLPSQQGVLPVPARLSGEITEGTRWTLRTPAGLILGDWREPHGWRVSVDGLGCHVLVPDYAPPGTGYHLHLAEDGEALVLAFDVA